MVQAFRINGKVYPVVFDLNAMEMVEQQSGKPVSETLQQVDAGSLTAIKQLVYAVFVAGAWAKGQEFEHSAHQVFSWFDLKGKALKTLIELVLPEDKSKAPQEKKAETEQ